MNAKEAVPVNVTMNPSKTSSPATMAVATTKAAAVAPAIAAGPKCPQLAVAALADAATPMDAYPNSTPK